MTAAQATAHYSRGVEPALGDDVPPRMSLGRIIGGMIKGMVLRDGAPMKRNAPTSPSLLVGDERNLTAEQERLVGLIERFAKGGPAVCTRHPRGFFGPFTPQEWSIGMYKHVDHHLRQFGA